MNSMSEISNIVMYIYTCEKCKKVFKASGIDKAVRCKSCSTILKSTGFTEDEWKTLKKNKTDKIPTDSSMKTSPKIINNNSLSAKVAPTPITIIDWDPGYYPDITEATTDQKSCYLAIEKSIQKGHYVDINNNISYLFVYIYKLNRQLEPSKKTISNRLLHLNDISNSPMHKSIYNLDEKYRSFLNLYETTHPEVCKYVFPNLLFTDILLSSSKEMLKKDTDRYMQFAIKNNLRDSNGLMAVFYVYTNKIKKSDYVDTRFFEVFFGYNLKSIMTNVVSKSTDLINSVFHDVLASDYDSCGTNYLYQMYDFVPGALIGPNSHSSVFYYSQAELDKKRPWGSEHKTYKDMFDDSILLDGFLVPSNKDQKRKPYLQVITRAAENIYRKGAGLPEIGEGWVSESLLFHQIESAFPSEEVIQHASPYFIGMQHYDVYLPDKKIALEYQGEQHFTPVDFFGGEEGFTNGQIRDERKRKLSSENGVTLIEVLPGYNLETVIREVLTCIIGADAPYFEEELATAIKYANEAKLNQPSPNNKDIKKTLSKSYKSAASKAKQKNEATDELNKIIKILASKLKPSPYAGTDFILHAPKGAFDKWIKEYEEICEMSKNDPETAYKRGIALMNSGYRAPAIYERMSVILRKLKRPDEEINLLLQAKIDFGYDYSDRIRSTIKKNYSKYSSLIG